MNYETNIPRNLSNSFWTHVKTRWSYDQSESWIKLMGVTDTLWDSSFHKVEGIFDIIKENIAVTIIAYIITSRALLLIYVESRRHSHGLILVRGLFHIIIRTNFPRVL